MKSDLDTGTTCEYQLLIELTFQNWGEHAPLWIQWEQSLHPGTRETWGKDMTIWSIWQICHMRGSLRDFSIFAPSKSIEQKHISFDHLAAQGHEGCLESWSKFRWSCDSVKTLSADTWFASSFALREISNCQVSMTSSTGSRTFLVANLCPRGEDEGLVQTWKRKHEVVPSGVATLMRSIMKATWLKCLEVHWHCGHRDLFAAWLNLWFLYEVGWFAGCKAHSARGCLQESPEGFEWSPLIALIILVVKERGH